jgi:hypothetical protein
MNQRYKRLVHYLENAVRMIWMIVFGLVSCDKPTISDLPAASSKKAIDLLRYAVYQTDMEKCLSFPVLFDQRVLVKNAISRIKRRLFTIESNEFVSGKILREEYIYNFHSGAIQSMELYFYYEDRLIGKMKIAYPKAGNIPGFKEACIVSDSSVVSDYEYKESGYQLHTLKDKQQRYLVFKEKTNGTHLFFMLKKNFWGALSIDSILHPSPLDPVVLGSPLWFFKRYHVANVIKEKNAHIYSYSPYNKQIKRIEMDDFPFLTSRSFFYDTHGYCSGYTDSTFTSKKFLARIVTNISLNAKKLPVLITHRKETAFRNIGITSIEQFEYTHQP